MTHRLSFLPLAAALLLPQAGTAADYPERSGFWQAYYGP